MIRVSREPFPQFVLPTGYSFTWFPPGCEAWWIEIQSRADPHATITHDTFQKYFWDAPEEIPRRQCFLLAPDGQPIGTATAWFNNNYHSEVWGRLHWVAILPEFQGCGLAKPLLSVVCARLRELHPERAFLRTAAHRLQAIAMYLKFGFVPEIKTDEEEEGWARILRLIRPSRPQRADGG